MAKNPISEDSMVDQVETALEEYRPCTVKELLSDLSFEQMKEVMVAAQKQNAAKRELGESLPILGITVSETELAAYNSTRPYQNEIQIKRDRTTGKIDIATSEACPGIRAS